MVRTFQISVACVALLFAIAERVQAGVIINVTQLGNDVHATLSGNINLNATLGSSNGTSGGYNGFHASDGGISFNFGPTEVFRVNVTTWTPFGLGDFSNWSTSTGNVFAMYTNPNLGVPIGYVSGANLSASAIRFNSSFSSLGFTPGSYVTTLTNGNVRDTYTVNIIPPATIPEPTSLAIWGVGALGMGVVTRRRRGKQTNVA